MHVVPSAMGHRQCYFQTEVSTSVPVALMRTVHGLQIHARKTSTRRRRLLWAQARRRANATVKEMLKGKESALQSSKRHQG